MDHEGDTLMTSTRTTSRGPGPKKTGTRGSTPPNAGKRAKWVSDEERNKRREQGRCLRCGGSGHLVRDCPYAPARRPEKNGAVSVNRARFEPELEDDYSAESGTESAESAQGNASP